MGWRMGSLKVMENLQRNHMSNLTLIFHLILCLLELNTAFIGLDWDECMHIRIVKDLVPPSTLGSSLSVH